MPLFKRKPFPLAQPPLDLKPEELIFQVRFTKEIFRNYQEYLKRINLYRQRVWTCKVTGKTNLTYEEALVSEKNAVKKLRQFPEELMAPALHVIQFSTLRLKDLVNTIFLRLQEHLFEGQELYARNGQSICPCRILIIVEKDTDNMSYEVGWLNKNKEVTGVSIIDAVDLVRRKLPFSRNVLKSFIRESTSQSAPWVVHDKLARKYGILREPPEGLRDKILVNGCLSSDKRQENKAGGDGISDSEIENVQKKKRKKQEAMSIDVLGTKTKKPNNEEKPKEVRIKYPIDDLLVKPSADDPVFTDRPSPARDFRVPMDCFGDLLMVWDFCSSFSRLLHLWPFSLEDFESAVCHKDSDLTLIAESHLAILRLLIREKGDYFDAIQRKRRKSKISLMNWTEYLCDLLEMQDMPELSSHIGIVKRGHYGLLDPHVKLGIFRELVSHALSTNAVREQLDEYIEQQQQLSATKRETALEEVRKRRGEQQHMKETESKTKEVTCTNGLVSGEGNLDNKVDVSAEGNQGKLLSNGEKASANGGSCHTVSALTNIVVDQSMNAIVFAEDAMESSNMDNHTKAKEQRKRKNKESEVWENKTREQRKEHLERELEKRFIRSNPLGKDRNYNRYWFFRRDGRIFVESLDSKQWGYYTMKEELDAFVGSLNPKGERERALQKQIEKHYDRICSALQRRSKDISLRIALEHAVLRRSTRVRAQPKDNPAAAFLRYVNKWRED